MKVGKARLADVPFHCPLPLSPSTLAFLPVVDDWPLASAVSFCSGSVRWSVGVFMMARMFSGRPNESGGWAVVTEMRNRPMVWSFPWYCWRSVERAVVGAGGLAVDGGRHVVAPYIARTG